MIQRTLRVAMACSVGEMHLRCHQQRIRPQILAYGCKHSPSFDSTRCSNPSIPRPSSLGLSAAAAGPRGIRNPNDALFAKKRVDDPYLVLPRRSDRRGNRPDAVAAGTAVSPALDLKDVSSKKQRIQFPEETLRPTCSSWPTALKRLFTLMQVLTQKPHWQHYNRRQCGLEC